MNKIRGFETREETLDVEGLRIKICLPTDADQILDNFVTLQGNENDIPYWADLWHSAIALAIHLVKHPELVKGKTVLEVGCGIGLPGVVAGMLGASRVIFTDHLKDPLGFAEVNARLNGVSGATFFSADWARPKELPQADILLASDIAYERRFFPPLVQLFRHFHATSEILFTEPSRELARGLYPLLRELSPGWQQSYVAIDHKSLKINASVNYLPTQAMLASL